jgi:hypothetical protein
LSSARDRSGIFALEGQKLERIARSCRKAAGCAQTCNHNYVGILAPGAYFMIIRRFAGAQGRGAVTDARCKKIRLPIA